jgi:hypothetical protein
VKKSVIALVVSVLLVLFMGSCASTGSTSAAPAASAAAPAAAAPAKASDPVASAAAPLVLKADAAKLKDGGGEGIRLEDAGNVGWWSSVKDLVSWTFQVADAGDYTLKINYSVDAQFANSAVKITVGDKSLDWAVASTETWKNFVDFELGTVALAAGPQTITFQATKLPDRFVANVKSITITKK